MASGVYLFIGEDAISKEVKLAHLKKEFLPSKIQEFNLDVLYAKDVSVKELREKILFLPVKSKKRIVVIKDITSASLPLRQFILDYLKSPLGHIILVMDTDRNNPKDSFIAELSRLCRVFTFEGPAGANTFTLSRAILGSSIQRALALLHQLLNQGEEPERILGGLRYALNKEISHPSTLKKALRYLLSCDIELKSAAIKPQDFKERFALEKLVVRLCSLTQFQREA